jgi:cobalamin synthase
VPVARVLRAALGVGSALAAPRDLPRDALVAGLAVVPVVGAGLGVVAGAAAGVVSGWGVAASAVAGVGTLAVSSAGRPERGLGAVTAPLGPAAVGVVVLARLCAVAAVPPAGLPLVLGLATMLGRWALVVQCYGGYPHGGGLASQIVGRARLREFGWASTLAFGATLALLDAVGLVVLLAAVLVAIAARVLAYRRARGVSETALWATVEAVETTVLLVLALLTR